MEAKNGKPSELAEAMMQYLDCECRYFPPMRDDTELCAAYRDARRDATDGGYVPMLIKMRQASNWTTIRISNFKQQEHNAALFSFQSKDFPKAEIIDLR